MHRCPKPERCRDAFTLTDLVVVLFCIAVGLVLAVPLNRNTCTYPTSRATTMMNCGKNIYVSIFAATLDESSTVDWPDKGRMDPESMVFPTSTDYWRHLVTSGAFDVGFDYFGAQALPSPHDSLDPLAFEPRHNAWCIAAGVDEATRDGSPVLYSRNITTPGGRPLVHTGQEVALDGPRLFEKKRKGVVVYQGGAAIVVFEDTLSTNVFNSPGDVHAVLHP